MGIHFGFSEGRDLSVEVRFHLTKGGLELKKKKGSGLENQKPLRFTLRPTKDDVGRADSKCPRYRETVVGTSSGPSVSKEILLDIE